MTEEAGGGSSGTHSQPSNTVLFTLHQEEGAPEHRANHQIQEEGAPEHRANHQIQQEEGAPEHRANHQIREVGAPEHRANHQIQEEGAPEHIVNHQIQVAMEKTAQHQSQALDPSDTVYLPLY
ncbi:hypothetical protein KP79_PYT21643 [Mizuhopecten yessoensis]|uniref:Uncharacterized protein n=1 Tax=Mizuhopecten yessoensis TaxID=6573 RepID=A0A210Q3X1_MIZYE|nr:hypothetical protein KP79_PYT21643 [Mizuhopecten yessoensis]